MQAKSTREHSCGLLFLSAGKFYMNVKCFERFNTEDDQPFRDRARVIKGSPGNRRSRSSRTDSFTDSLLLRQRSQSTPLAQVSHSLLIDVQEDPDAIIEEIDAGVDLRISRNDLRMSKKASSLTSTGSLATEDKTRENTCISDKGASALEKDSSVNKVIRIEDSEPVLGESVNDVPDTAEVKICEGIKLKFYKFYPVHPTNASAKNNKASLKLQKTEVPQGTAIPQETEAHERAEVPQETGVANKTVEICPAGNIVKGLGNEPKQMTETIDVEDIDIDVEDDECVDDNVCQRTAGQEVELNLLQENCLSDVADGARTRELEDKSKATVTKDKIRADESTLQEEEATMHVERTEVSNDDEVKETVSSPNVKERIMFFNSG